MNIQSNIEENRIKYLHGLEILDSDFDMDFDRITDLLRITLRVPIALLSLVDKNRLWFKSHVGINVREIPREESFCTNAIKQDGIYVINDTLLDPLYINNSLVISHPYARFYAGKPIFNNNFKLGTLCIIDTLPRELSEYEEVILNFCANFVESEIKKMNYIKKLQTNEDNMKTISAIISHDLINSISPIISLSNFIIEYPNTIDENIENIKIINECAINSCNLSRDLLDNYKIDLNNLTLHKEYISINDILKIYNNDNQIKIVNGIGNKELLIDKLRIDQLLNNLITNSKKYIDINSGTIIISIEKNHNNYLFSISDNGIGIPSDKKHLLFKKFSENINPSHTIYKPRTGLGLFICKSIIELHNGSIYIDDCKIGTTICFTIPIIIKN